MTQKTMTITVVHAVTENVVAEVTVPAQGNFVTNAYKAVAQRFGLTLNAARANYAVK